MRFRSAMSEYVSENGLAGGSRSAAGCFSAVFRLQKAKEKKLSERNDFAAISKAMLAPRCGASIAVIKFCNFFGFKGEQKRNLTH